MCFLLSDAAKIMKIRGISLYLLRKTYRKPMNILGFTGFPKMSQVFKPLAPTQNPRAHRFRARKCVLYDHRNIFYGPDFSLHKKIRSKKSFEGP